MGLLNKISGWFSSDSETSGPLFLLDGASLLNQRPGTRPSPRDMIGLLYRLARFAEKEKIRVTVIFEGEPLHKAADGDEFQGVTVYYAENAADRRARMSAQIRQSRKNGATVVSEDPALEKEAAGAGVQTLRASTFRKAMEIGPDGDSFPNDGRPRRGGMRGRRAGRGGPRNGGRDEGGRTKAQGSRPQEPGRSNPPPAEPAPQSPDVRQYIDVVD